MVLEQWAFQNQKLGLWDYIASCSDVNKNVAFEVREGGVLPAA